MLKSSDMEVHVHILESLSDIHSRQELADRAHQLIREVIEISHPI